MSVVYVLNSNGIRKQTQFNTYSLNWIKLILVALWCFFTARRSKILNQKSSAQPTLTDHWPVRRTVSSLKHSSPLTVEVNIKSPSSTLWWAATSHWRVFSCSSVMYSTECGAWLILCFLRLVEQHFVQAMRCNFHWNLLASHVMDSLTRLIL